MGSRTGYGLLPHFFKEGVMLTVGLDLSFTGTGIVVLYDGRIVHKAIIKSNAKKGNTLERLLDIVLEIKTKMTTVQVMHKDVIDLVCIEGASYGSRKTSYLFDAGRLMGIMEVSLLEGSYKYVVVPPTMLKKFATGKGNAAKDIVIKEVYKVWNQDFDDNNICDAFVLAKIAQAVEDETMQLKKHQKEVLKKLGVGA